VYASKVRGGMMKCGTCIARGECENIQQTQLGTPLTTNNCGQRIQTSKTASRLGVGCAKRYLLDLPAARTCNCPFIGSHSQLLAVDEQQQRRDDGYPRVLELLPRSLAVHVWEDGHGGLVPLVVGDALHEAVLGRQGDRQRDAYIYGKNRQWLPN